MTCALACSACLTLLKVDENISSYDETFLHQMTYVIYFAVIVGFLSIIEQSFTVNANGSA